MKRCEYEKPLLFMSLRSCCRTTKCEKKNPIDFEKQQQQQQQKKNNNRTKQRKTRDESLFCINHCADADHCWMRAHAPNRCVFVLRAIMAMLCTSAQRTEACTSESAAKIDGICIYYTYFSRIRITYKI